MKIRGYENKEVIVDCRHAKFWFYQDLKRMANDGHIHNATNNNEVLAHNADWSTCSAIRRALDRLATGQREMRFPESEFMQRLENVTARSKGAIAANELFETIQFFNGIGRLFSGTEGEMGSVIVMFVEANTFSEALEKVKEAENTASSPSDEDDESDLPV